MNTEATTLSRPLHKSLQFMNDPVQLAGNVIYSGTTKFTIAGNDSYSVVSLTFLMDSAWLIVHKVCAGPLLRTQGILVRGTKTTNILVCVTISTHCIGILN